MSQITSSSLERRALRFDNGNLADKQELKLRYLRFSAEVLPYEHVEAQQEP